jgi:hypothetical protein
MNASEIMQNVRYLLNKHYAIYATGFAKGINDKEYKYRSPITAKEALDVFTDHLAGMSYKQIQKRSGLSQPSVYRIIQQNRDNNSPTLENISWKKPKRIPVSQTECSTSRTAILTAQ